MGTNGKKTMIFNDFLYLREMIRYFKMNELIKFWMISEVQGVHIHNVETVFT